jgi:von Willebrand factor type A domain
VLTHGDLLDLFYFEWQVYCFSGTNSATLNFDFTQYSTKSEIVDAISNLPKIIGNGNDVASAELMLKNSLFMDCPLRSNSQCVAVILYDNYTDDPAAVNTAAQVNACL